MLIKLQPSGHMHDTMTVIATKKLFFVWYEAAEMPTGYKTFHFLYLKQVRLVIKEIAFPDKRYCKQYFLKLDILEIKHYCAQHWPRDDMPGLHKKDRRSTSGAKRGKSVGWLAF